MEEYKIHGITVYSNDKLQSKLENVIVSDMPSDLKPIFKKLIKTKRLVAFNLTKNMLQKLLNKIRRHRLTGTLGTSSKERMYVLWDNKISGKQLIETIIHESMHFAAFQNYNLFSKINFPIFYKFYSYFYKEYLKAKSFDKDLFNKFIILLTKQDKTYILKFNNYRNIENAFKFHTSLDIKDFEYNISNLLDYMNEMWDVTSRPNARYSKIVVLIKKTYRHLFNGFDERTYVGQEMFYPSEIISVLSTINIKHPNIKKTLQILK